MREQKGITLIALVVTIIVLLILAGVSIAMLTGDNGLLTKAEEAEEAGKYGALIASVNTELAALQIDVLAGRTVDESKLKDAIEVNSAEEKVTVTKAKNVDDEDVITVASVKTEAMESATLNTKTGVLVPAKAK